MTHESEAEKVIGLEVSPDSPRKAWNLRLYVAGDSPKSRRALANLHRLCEQYLQGEYTVQVVDLLQNPSLAKTHQIVAIPTLIRELPEPIKRVIGDLSDADKAMLTLDLRGSELPRK
jgi:circadian clock protein KaiB